MNDPLQSQLETSIDRLEALIQRGWSVCQAIAAEPSNPATAVAVRQWQQDCGVLINELSGGSKAHWLARSFSEAFLVRGTAGAVVEMVPPAEIVERLLEVLGQALASLSHPDALTLMATSDAPAPRRFDFVHNAELRPVLEQAYADGRHALDQGENELALLTYCGILEAIVTDALEHNGIGGLSNSTSSGTNIADWSFDTRLSVAEKAGLIRGGCARLPAVARSYRELDSANRAQRSESAISERDARLTSQVLHVVMRDLNPGR